MSSSKLHIVVTFLFLFMSGITAKKKEKKKKKTAQSPLAHLVEASKSGVEDTNRELTPQTCLTPPLVTFPLQS